MFYQAVLPLLVVGGSVCALAVVIYEIVICRLARWRFQKASRGLPMPDEASLLGNGMLAWCVRRSLYAYHVKKYRQLSGKTFGSLLRTKPAVLTIDLELIKRIFAEGDKHIDKHKFGFPIREFDNSILTAEGDEWRKLRRHFGPAFTKFKTPEMVGEIERSISKLIGFIDEKLAIQSEQASGRKSCFDMEIDEYLHRYSLDLFFSCFYKQPESINFDDKPCRWTRLVDEGFTALRDSRAIHACLIFPILVPIFDWLIYHFHPQGAWRQEMMTFIKQQTRLALEARKQARELRAQGHKFNPDNFRLSDGSQFQRNMVDHVIDHFLDGKLTKDEFFNTSYFLLNAGDKTQTDVLIHTLYQLAVNAGIQERLRQSIKEEGPESEYLGWVINESLRLMPPIGSGPARTLAHEMEIEGGRYVLPKGTLVVMPIYGIHRLPEYWGQDSEEFKPERWRDTSRHHPYQFMPFGAGPRSCPGKEFALFHSRRLLAALLTRYKFQAEPKDDLQLVDAPFLMCILFQSHFRVTISNL